MKYSRTTYGITMLHNVPHGTDEGMTCRFTVFVKEFQTCKANNDPCLKSTTGDLCYDILELNESFILDFCDRNDVFYKINYLWF